MSELSHYCKAYLLDQLRNFSGWNEERADESDKKDVLIGDTIVYLHQDFTVTHGIFKDEKILFRNVSPEWREFCEKELGFQIPEYCKEN